jgi:hypothetical protein
MREDERLFFTTRFARDTESTEGLSFFSNRETAIGEKYAIDFPSSTGKSNEQILCDLCDSVVKSKNRFFKGYHLSYFFNGSF